MQGTAFSIISIFYVYIRTNVPFDNQRDDWYPMLIYESQLKRNMQKGIKEDKKGGTFGI